jgi:plasmid replication initiation protein
MFAKKPNLPVGRTMRVAHEVRANFEGDEIVKAKELIEVRYAKGQSLSLASRKVLNLLIGKAAGDAWKPGSQVITKRELRGSHDSNDRLPAILDELMTTTFKLAVTSRRGLPAVLTAALLAWNIEETSETDDAIIEFEFTEPARKALRESNQYAIMNRAAVLSFDCKYSVTLYEIGCQRWQKRDVSWDGTPADLRAILGVPENTYDDWANLRRRVLDPAIEEVNHLAPFVVSIPERGGIKRQGRKVVGIRLEFWEKEDADKEAAFRELERSRVGRKARRTGKVETVAQESGR